MRIIRHIKTLQTLLARMRKQGKTIGFVPTMGYFHEGHLSLMRQAKSTHDICVVSIYVNPKQFGLHEDLDNYPRDFRRDSSLARKENVDIVFAAPDNEIYPDGYLTTVDVKGVSDVLCGAYRPGHFQGVATIVAKLLNIVGPCSMFLGAKDAQQVVVLKQLVQDLNFPVKVIVGKTIREADGLAMSSRNVYLSVDARQQAVIIWQALYAASDAIKQGVRSVDKIIDKMHQVVSKSCLAKVQYIACVDAKNLRPVKRISDDVLIAVAVYFDKTRLIDNIIVRIHGAQKNKN